MFMCIYRYVYEKHMCLSKSTCIHIYIYTIYTHTHVYGARPNSQANVYERNDGTDITGGINECMNERASLICERMVQSRNECQDLFCSTWKTEIK